MQNRWRDNDFVIGVAMTFLTICLIVFVSQASTADHSVKKGGHDLYWKNWIALADDDAFVNDSLVASFLEAEEGLPTDTQTGEFVIASERRAYSPDHQIGWLLQVIQKADVKNENGQTNKIYGIKTHLVFDLRAEEKK